MGAKASPHAALLLSHLCPTGSRMSEFCCLLTASLPRFAPCVVGTGPKILSCIVWRFLKQRSFRICRFFFSVLKASDSQLFRVSFYISSFFTIILGNMTKSVKSEKYRRFATHWSNMFWIGLFDCFQDLSSLSPLFSPLFSSLPSLPFPSASLPPPIPSPSLFPPTYPLITVGLNSLYSLGWVGTPGNPASISVRTTGVGYHAQLKIFQLSIAFPFNLFKVTYFYQNSLFYHI